MVPRFDTGRAVRFPRQTLPYSAHGRTGQPKGKTMDSRTFRMISDVLRSTALTDETRNDLVNAFTKHLESVPTFDGGKFRHESTRGRRTGESPTLTLDERLPMTPEDFRDYVADFDECDDETWNAFGRMSDATLVDILTRSIDEHDALLRHVRSEIRATAAFAVIARAEEDASRRDRTPGAWVLPDGEAPIGPFPDENGRTGTEIATEYVQRNGLQGARVVFRKG